MKESTRDSFRILVHYHRHGDGDQLIFSVESV
jgi:hypothetical protein